ncbi:MAG: BON domain-containing protein [Gammaproteobacteria bacterium]|nr:BON domain-containing protein [Gammaproteobacteria bacterium]
MRNRFTPALIAGSLALTFAAAPLALAGKNESKDTAKMEQYTSEAQSAIKDAWLQGKLESALLFNQYLNSFAINSDVKNGVASLSGAVESDVDRELAGEIAESIDGVKKVRNDLVVDKNEATAKNDEADNRSKFRQKVDNATLTARIKTELLMNGSTSGLAINVDSRNGEVVLSGEVDSGEERALAEQIAANIDGTQSVENKLTVRGS